MWKNATLNPTQLAAVEGLDVDDPICAHGGSKRVSPVGLKHYNTTTNRAVYETYKKLVAKHPQLGYSGIQLENYSFEAVRAVNDSATAYPHRDDDILV